MLDLVITVNIYIVPISPFCYHIAEERGQNKDDNILKHRGGHDENQSRCYVLFESEWLFILKKIKSNKKFHSEIIITIKFKQCKLHK